MGCRTYEVSNERLARVIRDLQELQEWALADCEHATENEAFDTADDDRKRAECLERAVRLLKSCYRY